ncbi:MAG TPA: nucleotidyltransferase family protein [Thermoanaerobaculia bacterium]|nr:nucleotidyltransferase family protein [Thermoanaerobaculia bacterium]
MTTAARRPPAPAWAPSERAVILRLVAEHGASEPRVFGSVARGEAGEDSDLDLLVKAGPDTSAWFPAGLIQDLEALLGCRVDVVTEGALHWALRDRILREAVPL